MIIENKKMDSAVYSDGFVHIVLAEMTVDVLKSDTKLCDCVLKHGEKLKIKDTVQSFQIFSFLATYMILLVSFLFA